MTQIGPIQQDSSWPSIGQFRIGEGYRSKVKVTAGKNVAKVVDVNTNGGFSCELNDFTAVLYVQTSYIK